MVSKNGDECGLSIHASSELTITSILSSIPKCINFFNCIKFEESVITHVFIHLLFKYFNRYVVLLSFFSVAKNVCR